MSDPKMIKFISVSLAPEFSSCFMETDFSTEALRLRVPAPDMRGWYGTPAADNGDGVALVSWGYEMKERIAANVLNTAFNREYPQSSTDDGVSLVSRPSFGDAPRSRDWEPSEDDLADMAMFLECLYHDVAYGRAPEPRDPRWHRIAAMVFDHPSYVPSIKAEWKALADQKVELVPQGELAALKERDAAILRADEAENQTTHYWKSALRAIVEKKDALKERDAARAELAAIRAQASEQAKFIQELKMERDAALAHRDFWKDSLKALRLTQASEPGNHNYHGPVVDGKTVPDEAHERFHRSVGDVLSGKIMPKAREQMREALGKSPPHAPTTASTGKPMPKEALGFGPQAIGIKLPI